MPPIHPSASYERAEDGSYPGGHSYTRDQNPTYDQKMKHVAGDIWEFKSHQVRLFYFLDAQGNFVITNGYLKKRMKLDRQEIQQAHHLQREFETGDAS